MKKAMMSNVICRCVMVSFAQTITLFMKISPGITASLHQCCFSDFNGGSANESLFQIYQLMGDKKNEKFLSLVEETGISARNVFSLQEL